MSSTVALIRTQALSHPLLFFAILVALLHILGSRVGGVDSSNRATRAPPIAALACVLCCYLVATSFYAATPAYVDHVEPSVASVSWAVMRGQPAYPDPTSASMYGLPYGPSLFLANGFAMKILGPSLTTSKAAGLASAFASLVILAVALYRTGSPTWIASLTLAVLAYLAFGVSSFWVRAEPLLLLCASLGALSLTLPAVAAAIVAGAAFGIGLTVKMSAVLYLSSVCLLVWTIHGRTAILLSIAAMALTCAAPFVMFDQMSLPGYLSWLESATAQGVRSASLLRSLEWSAVLVIPILSTAGSANTILPTRHRRLFALYLAGSIACSLPLAMKHGTGIYHYLPFLPLVAFCASNSVPSLTSLKLIRALALTAGIIGALEAFVWVRTVQSLPNAEIVEELQAIASEHRGTMAMGYTEDYRLSFFRPILVFAGQPYALDGASLMDWHWSGRAFPQAAIRDVRECAVTEWVMPAKGTPFTLPDAYLRAGNVFDSAFVQAFNDTYFLARQGKWFDVWQCQRPPYFPAQPPSTCRDCPVR